LTTATTDLETRSDLQVRENLNKGVYVDGLTKHAITNAKEAIALLHSGLEQRKVASTAMNEESSRSHSLFTLHVESIEKCNGLTRSKHSRFNLVDLAGSERQKTTESTGDRLKEASSINQSLSALGNVIKSLVDIGQGKQRHVHYRDSKLTFLLKDSLGGNSKTSIVANVSPDSGSLNETLSTLKFAQRAKWSYSATTSGRNQHVERKIATTTRNTTGRTTTPQGTQQQ
jgi:kinesin family protein 15